jgi:hypothetical protein
MIEALADVLSFLDTAHIGEVIPLVPKASAMHEDIRDTASPRYITEAIFGFRRPRSFRFSRQTVETQPLVATHSGRHTVNTGGAWNHWS